MRSIFNSLEFLIVASMLFVFSFLSCSPNPDIAGETIENPLKLSIEQIIKEDVETKKYLLIDGVPVLGINTFTFTRSEADKELMDRDDLIDIAENFFFPVFSDKLKFDPAKDKIYVIIKISRKDFMKITENRTEFNSKGKRYLILCESPDFFEDLFSTTVPATILNEFKNTYNIAENCLKLEFIAIQEK